MTKPVLYTFGGSVWAAVPELAIADLGYSDDAFQITVVNLVEGENFKPSFIKLNSSATLPTLEADGHVYTNSTDVTSYIVRNAPIKVKTGHTELSELLHEDKYDPNFALLLARNEEERTAKGSNIPGMFLTKRQAALEKYSATPEASAHQDFYDKKVAGNGALLAIYQDKVTEEVKSGFFKQSQDHFNSICVVLYEILPSHLPANGFIGNGRPGEADFHVAAWLARIAATVGAAKSEDGLKAFESGFGKPLPDKVAGYWNRWTERESWKKVYASGLH